MSFYIKYVSKLVSFTCKKIQRSRGQPAPWHQNPGYGRGKRSLLPRPVPNGPRTTRNSYTSIYVLRS